MRGSGCRDLLFFLGTLVAIAIHAAYTGAAPFGSDLSVLAAEHFPYGQYDGPSGEKTLNLLKAFDDQHFNAKIKAGDPECWVEIRLLRKTSPR